MSDEQNNTPEALSSTETGENPSAGVTTPDEPENGSQSDPNAGLVEARDRYRTERDAAREELAAVQARVNALIRSDVERVAGESLAMPGDFWLLSGNDVDAYLDDQGNVDYERVREDARLLLEERPLLGKRSLAVDHSQGRGNGIGNREPTWSALLTD